ncbi:hypothetical protein ACIBHY_52655 [Nonomuraea sp. NPDC050547]|uniref:hypothetical protein n=1 Tax=unclassified Nonomuraea TaxID=2593643 RepID=UPI0037A8C623
MLLNADQIDLARDLTEQIADQLGGYHLSRHDGSAAFWITRGHAELCLRHTPAPAA